MSEAKGRYDVDTDKKFEAWAIVDLFGHHRVAGKLSEQVIGGQSFIRVDIPELGACGPASSESGIPAFTELYGQGAIYRIAFVDEAAARTVAAQVRERPISEWSLSQTMRDFIAQNPDKIRGYLDGPAKEDDGDGVDD